ncbi:hypothetical protein [uncultured Methylobacterium sp.]|jgi:hypothetical protein|nr:hypothetical protein [uncultured Methylobacterium sp.]
MNAFYRVMLEQRTNEINDELAALNRADEELRTWIVRMRGG